MLAKINKIKNVGKEEREKIAHRVFQFVKGETCQDAENVRKTLQEELDFIIGENSELIIELNDAKRKN